MAETGPDRPILPWRLVAGFFLHCVGPFYLAAMAVAILWLDPSEPNVAAVLHRALSVSPVILGGYSALAALSVLGAALLDPLLRTRRKRRAALDPLPPARRAEGVVRQAIDRSRGRLGPRSDAAMARLQTVRWDFADPRQQAIAHDLAEAANASTAALETAAPDRRAGIMEMAAATFERLADAQEELAAASSLENERRAQVIAGYVETRYGPSDFSGSGN
jgi:hypothetical protein